MTENIYSKFRAGKCIRQELEWQNLKCSRCGAELPKYPKYDSKKNELKTCERCGATHMLVRNI